jgi:hypothetical protein
MGLIKKIDVEAHFAARRAMRLGGSGPMSRLGANWMKSAARSKTVTASAEALTLSHSSSGVSSNSTPVASGFGQTRLLRPPGSRRKW